MIISWYNFDYLLQQKILLDLVWIGFTVIPVSTGVTPCLSTTKGVIIDVVLEKTTLIIDLVREQNKL